MLRNRYSIAGEIEYYLPIAHAGTRVLSLVLIGVNLALPCSMRWEVMATVYLLSWLFLSM